MGSEMCIRDRFYAVDEFAYLDEQDEARKGNENREPPPDVSWVSPSPPREKPVKERRQFVLFVGLILIQ